MSEYIFDQIYGSQARRKKILSSNSFLYYRQIMNIKNKHIKNPQLYSQMFEAPTLTQQSPHIYIQKPAYSPEFLSTLDRGNFAIHKLNSHAFKIIKRNQKVSSANHNQNKRIDIKRITANRMVMTERKNVSRTISRDEYELREYLNRSQHSKYKTKQRQKYLTLSICSNKKIATPTTVNKTQRSISPFSTIRHSGISFIRS